MGFSPLDDSLPISTVCRRGGPTVLAVWTLILASKDARGFTRMTPSVIFDLWTNSREPVPLEQIEAAWRYLAEPDPESANPAEDGRRIVRDDGGWRVVSHERYRDKYRDDKQRAADAERQRRHRARAKGGDADEAQGGPGRRAATSTSQEHRPEVAPPRAEAGAGRISFQPSTWYETPEQHAADVARWHALVREVARLRQLSGLERSDPAEVAADASRFKTRNGDMSGAKLNPHTMSHERLKLTLDDLARLQDAALGALKRTVAQQTLESFCRERGITETDVQYDPQQRAEFEQRLAADLASAMGAKS